MKKLYMIITLLGVAVVPGLGACVEMSKHTQQALLVRAAQQGSDVNLSLAALVLRYGADVNGGICYGNTPVMIAANYLNIPCLCLLLKHNATVTTNNAGLNVLFNATCATTRISETKDKTMLCFLLLHPVWNPNEIHHTYSCLKKSGYIGIDDFFTDCRSLVHHAHEAEKKARAQQLEECPFLPYLNTSIRHIIIDYTARNVPIVPEYPLTPEFTPTDAERTEIQKAFKLADETYADMPAPAIAACVEKGVKP